MLMFKFSYTNFTHTGKCYKFVSSNATWINASQSCESAGGHLPSVHDKKTNDFLVKLSSVYTWLGGFRWENNLNTWGWRDGSEWNYSNWATGKPDSLSKKLLAMNANGMWEDIYDRRGSEHPYICQHSPTM